MELITIKIFDNPIDAHLLKNHLEAAAIPAFIFDEHMAGNNQIYNITVGGIKVKIPESHFEKALAITEKIFPSNKPSECPICESKNIHANHIPLKKRKGINYQFVKLQLLLIPDYYQNSYVCEDCSYEFLKD